MSIFNSGKLEKIKIVSYQDPTRKFKKNKGEFTCLFNPESYSIRSYNNYHKRVAIADLSDTSEFLDQGYEILSFRIIIDGTGVSEYNPNPFSLDSITPGFVKEQVELFQKNVVEYDGELHQPRFLRVQWGNNLDFPCRLTTANFNYTLFSRSGDPLRVEIDTEFSYDEGETKSEAEKGKKSPDLSRIHLVKAGEQLPSLCQNFYGSPMYYPLVAAVNSMDDFRNLRPGREIYFPPIEK